MALLVVSACGAPAMTPTPSPPAATFTPTPQSVAPSPEAQHTAERRPTATLVPTLTPRPTAPPTSTPLPGVASCTTYRPRGTEGPIWDIEIARNGMVWIAAYRGLARLNLRRGTWTNFSRQAGASGGQVWSITAGPGGSVWLALREAEGAAYFDGTSWAHYTSEDGLISDDVRSVSLAPDGSIWFATGEGASRWGREDTRRGREGDAWTHYTTANGLYSDRVERVLFTPDGRVWFAHREALTSLLPATSADERGTWSTYGESQFLAMRKALVSEDGRLWVGQAFFDPETQEWEPTVYRDIHVQGLAVDRQGGLWVARKDGALYIPDPVSSPPDSWVHYGQAEGLAGDDVFVIALESDRVVWFGTRNGASRCVLE